MTLLELINLLKKHLKLVVLLPLACALAMGMFSMLFMSNTYTATTSMYVLVKNNDSGNSSTLYSDLNASQMVTNDVATLLNSDRVTNETAKDLYGIENFADMVADETNCPNGDPEELLAFLSEVGHPVLGMEPFDM